MRVGERDRLDLDQSIGIVKERDAEQRLRDAVEQWRNDIPDRTSSDRFSPTTSIVVLSRSSGPVPASARATCKLPPLVQCLRFQTSGRHDAPLVVERASAGREHTTPRRGGALVRHARIESHRGAATYNARGDAADPAPFGHEELRKVQGRLRIGAPAPTAAPAAASFVVIERARLLLVVRPAAQTALDPTRDLVVSPPMFL
jgi:hypothetical protein